MNLSRNAYNILVETLSTSTKCKCEIKMVQGHWLFTGFRWLCTGLSGFEVLVSAITAIP